MPQQRRWLWPCSESKVLRHKHNQQIIYDGYPQSGCDHILCSGSDDELDAQQHRHKRRRIETLAHSYLSGKPLFISSAALKGPFDKRSSNSKDRYAHYVVGSPLLAEPARKSTSSKRLPPCPLPKPKSSKAKKRVGWNERSSLAPPIQPSSFFEDRTRSTAHTPEPSEQDETSSASSPLDATRSNPLCSPAVLHVSAGPALRQRSSQNSSVKKSDTPSLASRRATSPDRSQMESGVTYDRTAPLFDGQTTNASPVWGVAAPAGFTPINQPTPAPSSQQQLITSESVAQDRSSLPLHGTMNATENPLPKAQASLEQPSAFRPNPSSKGKLPPLRASKGRKKKYLETVETHDDSPLIFRRRREPKTSVPVPTAVAVAPGSPHQREISKPKVRRTLFDSSINVPTQPPKSTKQPTSSLQSNKSMNLDNGNAPAIDISFDQGSLAMNFDFIDQHTNIILPSAKKSNRRKSVSEQLRRMMRLSGASITTSPCVKDQTNTLSPPHDERLTEKSTKLPSSMQSPVSRSITDSGEMFQVTHTGQTTVVEAMGQHIPVVSTQAAMEEAHLGLFNASSPVKAAAEPIIYARRSAVASQESRSAQAVSITPFHEFNAKIAAEVVPELQSPPPNTQAMFDNMSPFLSPEMIKKAARQQSPLNHSKFASVPEEGGKTSVLPPSSVQVKKAVQPSFVSSLAPTDMQDQRSRTVSSLHSVGTTKSQPRKQGRYSGQLDGIGAAGAFVDSQSLYSSPNVILSRRSSMHASGSEQAHVSQEDSIHFPEFLNEGQASRESLTNVDELRSTAPSHTSRRRSGSSLASSRKRSRKLRVSTESQRGSTALSLLEESVSQPEPASRRSLRSSILPLASSPSSSPMVAAPVQPNATGSTTIADDVFPSQQQTTVGGDTCSSNVFGQFHSGHPHHHPRASAMSAPPMSARSKASLRTTASSFQAAQRMDDIDLDSTIESITQTVPSPWNVESAMRRPLDASAG